MLIKCDLHIHSALSPCAENDMTPGNIVGMSCINGLDIIAITDHQTCGNVRSAITAANRLYTSEKKKIVVIPGMEIECQEGFHLLALFPDVQTAEDFEKEGVFTGSYCINPVTGENKIIELGAGRKLGKIWLPHDARAKTFQSKHTTIERFAQAFGVDKCAIVPQSKKLDQISAARAVIPRCEFNSELCEAGMDGLIAWEYAYNEDLGVFSREPLHNWASHPADAFAYGSQMMQELAQKEPEALPKFPVTRHNGRIVTIPLDEMWAETTKRNERY